ncbi:FAD synthetase family protein [Gemmobacter serpentinus]|uniref:FAD synthetase family protein n=1 Tax=Gemmobacter serpentinus TaxID=2652247 RepID=UPI00124F08AF|nr:FAD synthetase family protein [Gemmobacter serpentinus]
MGLDFAGMTTRIVSDRQLALPGSVLAIGAFDGVHRGHQALIGAAVSEARERDLPSVLWTFDPLPKVFFGRACALLSLRQRLALMAALGPDWIVVAPFNARYAARPAEAFLTDLGRINPQRIHIGQDFRFGARQSGDLALLARHFPVTPAPAITCPAGERISSTRIRALCANGRADAAAPLLRPPHMFGSPGILPLTEDLRFNEDHHD